MAKLRLKRHGTFSIREGWLEKAIHIIANSGDSKSLFSKDNGVIEFGIGSMMVTSLRYWLIATDIIDERTNQLSEFGQLLLEFDPYLDDDFSWWMIHEKLASNYKDAPILNIILNEFKAKNFQKQDLNEFVLDYLKDNAIEFSSENGVDSDIMVFLKTYTNEVVTDPEDNLNSPLGKLDLIQKDKDGSYHFIQPRHDRLNYLVVYYNVLNCLWDSDSAHISELMNANNSPTKLLKMDKNLFYLYLNEFKRDGLITINRTAEYDVEQLRKNITGKSDMKEKHKRYEECNSKISSFERELGRLESDKEKNQREIESCNKQIENLISKNKKYSKQRRTIGLVELVLKAFVSNYKNNEEKLKSRLEICVNENFSEVYSGTRKIEIDNKYNAVALNKVGDNWIKSETSPGLETVKNFAFIAGLIQCAKEKIVGGDGTENEANPNHYPLVLDAPFSQADEKHIPAISKLLASNAEQIILVVMKKDWNYAKDILNDKVGKSYLLTKESETHTNIIEEDL